MAKKNATDVTHHAFRYYDVFAVLIVVLTIISNIVSFKMVEFGPFTLRMGVFISAAAFVLADIAVELYGFARMRRIIWMAVGGVLATSIIFKLAMMLPGAVDWQNEGEFNLIFDRNLRGVSATLFAIFAGHMSNAMIMSKMKTITEGDSFWLRSLTSSFIGHGLNAILFYTFGKIGIMEAQEIIPAIVSSWFVRFAFEIVALPFTCSTVSALKKIEGVDVFDNETNLNPFRFSFLPKTGK